ncbi:hypothetical protein G9A89_002680 [Geosiphon pyriformis]|nr:hypothetical protein G9A89_002680 [Geosiphon pyriformis]
MRTLSFSDRYYFKSRCFSEQKVRPLTFPVVKSYLLQTLLNNRVPSLSEFVRLNVDFVAKSSPESNDHAALNGTWKRRFVTIADILGRKIGSVGLIKENFGDPAVIKDAEKLFKPNSEQVVAEKNKEIARLHNGVGYNEVGCIAISTKDHLPNDINAIDPKPERK